MNYNYDVFDSVFALLGGGLIVIGILIIGLVVVEIIAYWKIFKKAGKNGWESIVPIYSYFVLVEIAGLNWWWFLLIIIDCVLQVEIEGLTFALNICGFLASFNCYYNIARRFGKDKTTSIFAGIFPFIFVLIFAFTKNDKYDASIPVSVNGIFGTVYSNVGSNQSTENVDNESNNIEAINENNDNELSIDKDISKQEHSYCGNCGLKLDSDVRFCPNCGKEKI